MHRGVRIAILIMVSMLVTGCATKEWVQGLLGKQKAELGERLAGVEGRVTQEAQRIDKVEVRVGEEAQRVEGMGFRVKTLETSVGEVRETAKTAKDRADEAFAKAEGTEGKFSRFSANRHARSLVETAHIYFAFDRWDLDDGAQTALLSLIKEFKETKNFLSLSVEATSIGRALERLQEVVSEQKKMLKRIREAIEQVRNIRDVRAGKTERVPVDDNKTALFAHFRSRDAPFFGASGSRRGTDVLAGTGSNSMRYKCQDGGLKRAVIQNA